MNRCFVVSLVLAAGIAAPCLEASAREAEKTGAERPARPAAECRADAPRPADRATEAPRERRRPPRPDQYRRFRLGPGMWQAFARMEPEERKKMERLQREDPEKFQEVMRAKADELFRRREERRAALRKLADECRSAASDEEKARLKKQLTAEVDKDFREHLKANRRQLEEMKRRTVHLERELLRREENIDRAVAARVEAMINGEKPPRRHNSRRFYRAPLEK